MNSTLDDTNFCNGYFKYISNFILTFIGIFGYVLNILSSFIFFKIIRDIKAKTKNEDLFKYLFIKSLSNTYLCTINTFEPFKTFIFANVITTFAFQVIYQIFFNYFIYVFELFSTLTEVASIMNRYRKLINKYTFFDKISIVIFVILMLIYCCGFYVYKFIDDRVESVDNSTETIYILNEKVLGETSVILGYIHSSIRDGVCTVLMIIFNYLTLKEIKKFNVNKKKLVKANTFRNNGIEKGEKAEKRLTLMVLISTSMCLFCNGIVFIKYVSPEPIHSNECLGNLADLFFWTPNTIHFFLYYNFNVSFRNCFKFLILKK